MMTSRYFRAAALLLWAALAAVLAPVQAAEPDAWPARPVRLIIPFPPGGSNDVVGRVLATQLAERLGKPLRQRARPEVGAAAGRKRHDQTYRLRRISGHAALGI